MTPSLPSTLLSRLPRAAAAFFLSLAIGLVLFLLVGIAAPVWILNAAYGSQQLLDAPGHGGMLALGLMLLTVPIAGVIAFAAMIALTRKFYSLLSPRYNPSPSENEGASV
jgi:hypothetical protein